MPGSSPGMTAERADVSDRSPLVPIFLLLGGFVVTFASAAMGTAIMAMGVGESDDRPRGGLRTREVTSRSAIRR